MSDQSTLLTLMTFTPAAGALLIMLLKTLPLAMRGGLFRWVALFSTAIPLGFGLHLWHAFDPNGGVQFQHHVIWMRELNIEYFLGVDGISVAMVILTTIVAFLACIASFQSIAQKPAAYFCLFLLLETGMLGTFCALDMFLFYVFWEVMLLPMYFLIGIWGGPRKEYAAIKFFLYTLAGSVLILLAIIALYYASGRTNSVTLALADGTPTAHTLNLLTLAKLGRAGHFAAAGTLLGYGFAKVVFIALFVGFAIKVPMFPFHTWLPDAHVEAPTPISVILAGVLLKMGAYGMLRFNWAILPQATRWAAYGIAVCGVINIVYAAFVCMAQKDLKKLIAYSSVSHMGFVLLGLAACTPQAISGAVFQMWGHGIVSPMLFLLVGVLYDRAHSRDIDGFGGLAAHMPEYCGLTGLAFFASLGLPGLIGFVGEVLVLLGAWGTPNAMGTGFRQLVALGATAVIITAAYYLWTLQRLFLGRLNPTWQSLDPRLTLVERATLYPLGMMAVVFGVFPLPVLYLVNPALHALARVVSGKPAGLL